ncbi:hypothetical protein ACGFZL_22345 [Streptomyces sp. NPDC048182]|uniref:hypothetical protein n=1 Tax=Streptomyces sp. NPDC048182 TaxID=3365507 RepID=UPI003716B5D9
MNTERPDHDEHADPTGTGRPGGRRRSPAVVASVAAAVLLAGAGGAYLATSASGDGRADDKAAAARPTQPTPPPLALDGRPAEQGGGNGIAPGEPDPGGVVYRAEGPLPKGPGSAPVYRTGAEVGDAQVARLAKALGVPGAPVARGEEWRVGTARDGSGPLLTVRRQAPGTWTFARYAPGTDDCGTGPVCKGSSAGSAGAGGGTPVSEAAAKKAAAPVLRALGQETAALDTRQVMGAERAVNAEPRVGGLPTYGWTTGLVVGAGGEVVGGSGQLAAPARSDTYPVLDAERTLALLNRPGQGAGPGSGVGGCASPVPLGDDESTSCATVSAGEPGKRETATVESAVFGLAVRTARGRPVLVPSWLFQVRAPGAKDTYTVTHPAVDPAYLTPAAASPSQQPTGGPGTSRKMHVDGWTSAGRELTVHFTGGVCADYDAAAQESGGEVRVTVTATEHPDEVCIMIAKAYERTVPLERPLGDRTVIGSDGAKVPRYKPGARLPAPSAEGR